MRRIDPASAALFAVFTLSGFSGLIYESIWSHYLKLFLGHAAYAQTLVLAIFMGGLAIGSWLAGRFSVRWNALLTAYALVEGVIGLAALGFHGLFEKATLLSFEQVIPALGIGAPVQVYKWSLASLMILPQSILLGMTFPLMVAGLLRHRPATPGAALAMLYFTNSLGGAVGVLASGFALIEWFGLPGTIMTAGLLNVAVAIVTRLIARRLGEAFPVRISPAASAAAAPTAQGPGHYRLLLGVAALTGMASFFYEIGWIRMLSLVLGASTHAFELMLSAFIFGLAFGGLWIRGRIERLGNPLAFLGFVQVAMAFLALSTLFAYGWSFDVMAGAMSMFARSEAGYVGFNFSSHVIALAVMVPTTFCAGMTLPLLTFLALRQHVGERAIGGIYAANTVGSIVGVIAAVHLAMPSVGAKGVVIVGAAFDFGLGLVLLAAVPACRTALKLGAAAAIGALIFGSALMVEFDPRRMNSGVYRTGKHTDELALKVLAMRDGKTASVALTQYAGMVSISTNGKPDASVNISESGPPAADELTQNLAGALPLSLAPQAKSAAVIGIGSGMTTQLLLGAPGLQRVDTIEIEPLMVEMARKGFAPRNARVFEDARSRLHVEDAKTFFSTQAGRYDIIVSEPSNPWVSGVASLFSNEFYRTAVRHLEPGGLLVQWVQVYEIDVSLVASVARALSPWFSDYAIYNVDNGNVLIAARNGGRLENPSETLFANPDLKRELARVRIHGIEDIRARRIAGKRLLDPFFEALGAPPNSDYFPFVDLNATRTRFLRLRANEFSALSDQYLPVVPMLEGMDMAREAASQTPLELRRFGDTGFGNAILVRAGLQGKPGVALASDVAQAVLLLNLEAAVCQKYGFSELWTDALLRAAIPLAGYLPQAEYAAAMESMVPKSCRAGLDKAQQGWLDLLQAVSRRDAMRMEAAAAQLVELDATLHDPARSTYAFGALMLARLSLNQPRAALETWSRYSSKALKGNAPLLMVWLRSLALQGARQGKTGSAAAR